MKKKKILYIYHVSAIGGGSYCLLNIIKKLDREYFIPYVLLKKNGPLVDELKKIGVKVFFEKTISTVPYNRSLFKYNSLKQLFNIFLSSFKLKKLVKKIDAEIVHINTMMMYPYCRPIYNLNKKVIIHIREHWPKNEHVFQLNYARKTIQKYTHKIIAINNTSAKIIKALQKTEVIYDWIDFEDREEEVDFKKIFGNDIKKYKIFLFLGGIQTIKGTLEVVRIFKNKIDDKDSRLLIVGCDSKRINYQGLKGLIKRILHVFRCYSYSDKVKLNIQNEDRIKCIPATNNVKSLIEQSYCVVSYPTIPHAILPIAESIYLKKPIISAYTLEALEYSNGGRAAILFNINNREEFKKAIIFALNNETEIYNKAQEGSYIIKNIFSSDDNSNKLDQIYKNL